MKAQARPVTARTFAIDGDRTADYPPGRRLHASAPSSEQPTSFLTRLALRVHGLIARIESWRGGSSEVGVIHAAKRYDLMWGWLFSRTDGAIIRRLRIRPGDRVLDLGCGPGRLTRSMAKAVGAQGEAVGLDASAEMISRARRKVAPRMLTFIESRAERLPFPNAHFDAIVSRLLLHELSADALAVVLVEIRRVLRPGGRALLIDLPGTALNRAHEQLEAGGLACETGTVGFPFFNFVSFPRDEPRSY